MMRERPPGPTPEVGREGLAAGLLGLGYALALAAVNMGCPELWASSAVGVFVGAVAGSVVAIFAEASRRRSASDNWTMVSHSGLGFVAGLVFSPSTAALFSVAILVLATRSALQAGSRRGRVMLGTLVGLIVGLGVLAVLAQVQAGSVPRCP